MTRLPSASCLRWAAHYSSHFISGHSLSLWLLSETLLPPCMLECVCVCLLYVYVNQPSSFSGGCSVKKGYENSVLGTVNMLVNSTAPRATAPFNCPDHQHPAFIQAFTLQRQVPTENRRMYLYKLNLCILFLVVRFWAITISNFIKVNQAAHIKLFYKQ